MDKWRDGESMLRQLIRRGQLTVPVFLLKKFDLKEKDYVDVTDCEDGILIRPVSILDYSPREIEVLRKKLDRLPRGEKKVLDSLTKVKHHLHSLKER